MTSMASRFWFGALIPTVVLAAMLAGVLATGSGKREAPIVVFFASLVAVPATLLANQWTLFVQWRSCGSALLAGLVIPAVLVLAAMLGIHGSGRVQAAGFLVWLPFIAVPTRTSTLQLLALIWAVMLLAAFVAAWRLQRRRNAQSKSADRSDTGAGKGGGAPSLS
jgi:hypothetical protein